MARIVKRKCRFCESVLVGDPTPGKERLFCGESCRIAFRNGSKTFQRLMADLVKEATRQLLETAYQRVLNERMAAMKEEIRTAVDAEINRRVQGDNI